MRGMQYRPQHVARFVSVLALLANAVLLPLLHHPHVSVPAPVAEVSHDHHQHHANPGESDDEPDGRAHQICHFCRLLGIALPPPPSVAVEIAFVSHVIEWRLDDLLFGPLEPLRSRNLPRAPPSIA